MWCSNVLACTYTRACHMIINNRVVGHFEYFQTFMYEWQDAKTSFCYANIRFQNFMRSCLLAPTVQIFLHIHPHLQIDTHTHEHSCTCILTCTHIFLPHTCAHIRSAHTDTNAHITPLPLLA